MAAGRSPGTPPADEGPDVGGAFVVYSTVDSAHDRESVRRSTNIRCLGEQPGEHFDDAAARVRSASSSTNSSRGTVEVSEGHRLEFADAYLVASAKRPGVEESSRSIA